MLRLEYCVSRIIVILSLLRCHVNVVCCVLLNQLAYNVLWCPGVAKAREVAATFLNCCPEEVTFGANTTTLTLHVAR